MSSQRARAVSLPPTPDLQSDAVKGKQRFPILNEPDGDESLPELDKKLRTWRTWIADRVRVNRRNLRPNPEDIIEICDSVFAPFRTSITAESYDLRTLDHAPPIEADEFIEVVARIRQAIKQGRHPKLNGAGSSGSYLVRDAHTVLGIFKPKDEDPYGRLNPKWIKWFHRVLLSPLGFGFGRACLLVNFSYLSEAGASLLDQSLGSHIVPYTGLTCFSSPSFFYDWYDRKAARRVKDPRPLPDKPGSLQLFAHGFRDAADFLSEHPWPGRLPGDVDELKGHRARRRRQTSRFTKWLLRLKREDPADDDVASIESIDAEQLKQSEVGFEWNAPLMQDFRLQLEQLIVLDVLMRNTDRGLDNFMVKHCRDATDTPDNARFCPSTAHCHIAAIDNSLAFPHKHPSGWRTYPYGWMFLPASLIGQPFSTETRNHYLPLLTSRAWWAELTRDLRVLFAGDPDYSRKTFRKQMAVIKGQAYNLVQTLSTQGEGPLELLERPKCLVWDDLIEVIEPSSPLSVRSHLRPATRPVVGKRWASGSVYRHVDDEESLLLARKLAVRERCEEVHGMAFFRSC